MGRYALGQPVWRFEDRRLLTGHGRFVDDLQLSHMAHAVVLRSPHAHARILSIDLADARSMPGVLDILIHEDWVASGFADLPVGQGRRKGDQPMFQSPYPALAGDRVRWVGDPVAFVVAETREAALDAMERISVAYEPLPAVTRTGDVLQPEAPRVWEDCTDNICFIHEEGDRKAVDAAIAKAAHVIEHEFTINRVTAASTEPRGCLGHYDPSEDRYTIHSTLQRAHVFRSQLAEVLKVPESKLRVVAGDVGGSYGMKSAVYNEVPLVLLAARRIGRPVKWTSTRSEAFLSDGQGRDNVTRAVLALDQDMRFTALKVQTVANIGAYIQSGGEAFIGNLGTLAGVYTTPAIHAEVTAVFSNTNPVRPYRGNGRPEAAFVIERIIDIAARRLGCDPVALRRKNLIPPEAMPYRTALTFTYDCGAFEANMDKALALADAAGFEARRLDSGQRGMLRGLGVSNSIERAAAPGIESGEIRFDRAGSVTILSGAINQGQGHETVFKQLVCDRLGLDPASVHYISGDTDQVALGEGTGGSRSATIGGAALNLAAERLLAKAQTLAAHLLAVSEDDLVFAEGVFSSERSNRTLTIHEVGRAALNPASLPPGMEPGLVATAIYDNRAVNYPNGCHVCEVEVDPETGRVTVLGYWVVDDVGVVMNPLLLHGQIQGGLAQGLGQVLMEDIVFDPETGQLLSGSFMDYAMPRAHDFPTLEVHSNPVPTATNPLGVKGAGEAGNVGALPAVASAVSDALSPYGIEDLPMPATPERIWAAIRDAGSGRGAAGHTP